jgi:hypothetical protein
MTWAGSPSLRQTIELPPKVTTMRRMNNLFAARFCLCLLAVCSLLVAATPGWAATSAAVFPTGINFNPQVAGTDSTPQNFTVYNLGTTNITVTGATASVAQFVISGTFPVTILPAKWATFTVAFDPTTAKNYSGSISVAITDLPDQKVTLNGVGVNASAVSTLSSPSLTFSNQALGTTGTQALTITNNGSVSFKVLSVTLTYPFTQTGFSGTAISIAKGKSLTLQVSFFPTATGVTNGTMLIAYDILAPQGISLSGTGVASSALAVSTYPTLPSATQSSAYQATLSATAGTPPYTWSLASGSILPTGLSLSTAGVISGTLAAGVGIGSNTFTATATDSTSKTASAVLSLPVFAKTGAECNEITFDAGDGSGPLVDLMDLGTNYYLGVEEGGLYADGSNVRPQPQDSNGVAIAQGIGPLDANGNPSPTGKYVFISIGESVAQQPFIEFMNLAAVDPSLNPNMVIVNGATGGATASDMALPNNNFWNVILNDYLPNAGVTAKQVVVAWVNDVNGGPAGTFPSDMTKLQANFESIANNLLIKFPNIKLAYYSSINYTGYSNGLKNLSNEPWSYEAGFAVKNAIQDQINGNANLNYIAANGPVKAPWMSWGPYYWANGMNPRSDGLVWTCQDLQADGTHPSDPVGRIKVSTQLFNFLKSDDTASIWFLKPPSN